jgi:GT2 family glycosyltransferase
LVGSIAIPEIPVAKSFWEKVKAHERSFYNEQGDPLTDAPRFFPRQAFEKARGYDESLTGTEDWDLPERIEKLGYKGGRIKAKIFHYERISTPFSLARKKYYYALSLDRYLRKHKLPPISAKTVYFLRPIFYQNPRRLLSRPLLTVAMFIMFMIELFGGGLGYILGRMKRV